MRRQRLLLASLSLLAMAGCDSESDHKPPPPVRPVLSVVVKPPADRQVGFAGTIQPQFQTDRGFRVLGRMIARSVEVGDLVKAGQKLAQIDPLTYELAVRSSEADLAKAKSQLANAKAAGERVKTLFDKQVSNQADFDAAEQAQVAASASVQQAEANLAKAREQLGYTTLAADIDGVVTSTDAEVGQTASPGKKVMTLARTDIREAVVDLPEDVTRSLAVGVPFEIRLQADMSIATAGKVREIAPEADAATRTRRVRITLDQGTDPFRLGATITAKPKVATGQAAFEIPSSALLQRDGAMRVWVVDAETKTVRARPVEVAERDERAARIAGGLAVGDRVVVAGVNSLTEGQIVKIDEGENK